MTPIPLPKNPAWKFHPETGEVRHTRSGVLALTFTMNKRRLAKITTSSGTEVLVEVPAALPSGLLPIPNYPEYGFSQAEGRVYRAQGGWATFIPRALVPYRKKNAPEYYVWLLPSKDKGNKRQVSLNRIARVIAEQQGLDFAWLCENLPGVYQPTATDSTEPRPSLQQGDHSGHPVASDPEPTGAQHGASQSLTPTPPQKDGWYWWRRHPLGRTTCHYVWEQGARAMSFLGVPTTTTRMGGLWGDPAPLPDNAPAPNFSPDTTVENRPGTADRVLSPEPKFLDQPGPSQRRLPWFADWYWWRATKESAPVALYVDHKGLTGRTEHGSPIEPDEMIGEWGYRAPAPAPETGNPEPAPETPTGNPEPATPTSPFDLYPEGDPRWVEGEPETIEAPAPAPVFQPRIF